jgi:hypothetical protein
MTSSHNNTVTFTASEFASVKYVANSLVISPGQPSSPPASITNRGADWAITMNCGRHKTATVANQWNTATGGANNSYAPNGGANPPPKELNFYFALDITTKSGAKTKLYVGQGSYPGTNNWWIGGVDLVAISNKAVLAIGTNSTRETFHIGGTHKSFTFTLQ